MASQPLALPITCTPEEYLAMEREAEFKSEYFYGEIYAMAGASLEHPAIVVNLTGEMHAQLKGKPCQGFSNDTKVRATPDGLYAYPDLTIVCGEPQFHDARKDVLVNPTVLFEVLSDSTEAYDRGLKFENYQRLESLREYVLIAQDRPRVEVYARQPGNQWLLTVHAALEEMAWLESIGCTLRLADVYDRVEFKPKTEEAVAPVPQEKA